MSGDAPWVYKSPARSVSPSDAACINAVFLVDHVHQCSFYSRLLFVLAYSFIIQSHDSSYMSSNVIAGERVYAAINKIDGVKCIACQLQ